MSHENNSRLDVVNDRDMEYSYPNLADVRWKDYEQSCSLAEVMDINYDEIKKVIVPAVREILISEEI